VIKFNADGSVHADPVHLRKEVYKGLQERLLMFYTGEQRDTSSILAEQKANMAQKDKVDMLKQMVDLVEDLKDSLYKNNLPQFGEVMHKNWELKQKLAKSISNPLIQSLYNKALANGATGGKLLGAGGGGFLLFYCEPEKQQQLRSALQDYRELKFKFEHEGSKIVHVGDEY
jgi:D-glycero-alpha-D-manno-heptose-7-phosphate kinase